jgi:flagella basal body P-ring formation protein FlgA
MMKTSRSPSPTVRQITIAALLGTFPSVAAAQTPQAPNDSSARSMDDLDSVETASRVPVALRTLSRGAVLTADDIGYAPRSQRAAHPVPHSVAQLDQTLETNTLPAKEHDRLIGWTTRRVITAGERLGVPAIMPPQLVKSGELVEVSWKEGGILVTAHGRATRSAAVGERIIIRLPAQRSVEGSVVAAGHVLVN